MKPDEFFYYHAGKLAIDKSKPWQICTRMGVLIGQMPTEDRAKTAVDALTADHEAGTLPCNLSTWSKRELLEG